MNDRTSSAPPPRFLGPETLARSSASLPTAFLPPRSSHGETPSQGVDESRLPGRRERPRSASISEKKGLSGLWEGFREKIWGKKRPVSFDGGAVSRTADAARPTREEMLASYNELMESGFFEARAIQGTRQPRPASQHNASSGAQVPTGMSVGDGSAYSRPRLETIYSPPRMRPASPGGPTPALAPATPEKTLTAVATTPDSRGKKRNLEDEGDKTVRKLRKTTRSITELHSRLKKAREETHPPVSYATGAGGGLVRTGGVLTRRSFSGSRLAKKPARPPSRGREGLGRLEKMEISGPVTPILRLPAGTFDAMREQQASDTGSLRLRRVQADAALRSRTDADLSHLFHDRSAPQPRQTESANWVSHERLSQEIARHRAREASPSKRREDQNRAVSPQRQSPVRQGVKRKEPLCVVPDANRGIPNVPAIPAQFKFSSEMERGGENDDVGGCVSSFAEEALLP